MGIKEFSILPTLLGAQNTKVTPLGICQRGVFLGTWVKAEDIQSVFGHLTVGWVPEIPSLFHTINNFGR